MSLKDLLRQAVEAEDWAAVNRLKAELVGRQEPPAALGADRKGNGAGFYLGTLPRSRWQRPDQDRPGQDAPWQGFSPCEIL